MNIKGFYILDYKLNIVYNKDMHYPLQTFVYDQDDKLVYTSYYVTTDELRYGVHQEVLIHLYDGTCSVEILLTVESVYKELNTWIDEIDYEDMTSLQEDWCCSKCINKGENSEG